MKRRIIFVLITAAAALVAGAGPALAQRELDTDDLVVLQGDALVSEGETIETVVVFDGSATVEGTAQDVVAFNAPVTITGTVTDTIVSFSKRVTIRSGAAVGGDVISRSEPVIEEGATVGGELRGTEEFFRDPFPFLGRLAAWLAVSISILILGLLFLGLAPRAADAIEEAGRTALGPAVGWGLIMLIGLPILAIVAFITLVGIPFGFGLGLALFLIFAFGYTMAALILGRRLVQRPSSRLVAFLAGLLILRLLALIPIVAGIVGFIALLYGLGAVVVTVWRARRPVPAAAAA